MFPFYSFSFRVFYKFCSIPLQMQVTDLSFSYSVWNHRKERNPTTEKGNLYFVFSSWSMCKKFIRQQEKVTFIIYYFFCPQCVDTESRKYRNIRAFMFKMKIILFSFYFSVNLLRGKSQKGKQNLGNFYFVFSS